MAHQIFGDTESIFGYKDLQIDVYYSAGPLDIYYDVKFGKKVSSTAKSNQLDTKITLFRLMKSPIIKDLRQTM